MLPSKRRKNVGQHEAKEKAVALSLVVHTVAAAVEVTIYSPPFLWKKTNP